MYDFDGFDCSRDEHYELVLEVRGLDMAKDGPAAMADPRAITLPSPKKGEERHKTVAMFKGRLHTVVHMPRNGKCRIITMRRAHKDEEEAYHAKRT